MQNLSIRFITYTPPFSCVTPYLRGLYYLRMLERRFVHFVCFLNSVPNSQLSGYRREQLLEELRTPF